MDLRDFGSFDNLKDLDEFTIFSFLLDIGDLETLKNQIFFRGLVQFKTLRKYQKSLNSSKFSKSKTF